jgi:hypothetical protein
MTNAIGYDRPVGQGGALLVSTPMPLLLVLSESTPDEIDEISQ